VRRWLRHASFWLRRRRMEDDLREEMETHRAMREDALARAGASAPTRASRRALGNTTLAMDDARDVWIWPWLDGFARDVRHALRGLRRRPGFAVTSIATIAIGAAALASVFAVVQAVLLRPAPYPNASRIVQVEQTTKGRSLDEVSAADILALREGAAALSHVTLAWFSESSIAGGSLPERAKRVYTDAQAFDILGTPPLLGRLPSAADEHDGDPVVVIGHRIWSSTFASDPDIVGRRVRIDGISHTVIGVMPAGFRFPAPYWSPGDLWLLRGPSHSSWPQTRSRTFLAFGLLKDGATLARAQQEAGAVALSLDARFPDPAGPIGLQLTEWAGTVRAEAQPRLLMILAAAGVVFLIVCVNVVNLLVGRGMERQRELLARAALGAGPPRLVRQLLTETLVVFALGGAAGLGLAVWGARLIVSMRSFSIPRMDEASIDIGVALSVIAVTLVAGLIAGVVPALQGAAAGRAGLVASDARGASAGRRWRRLQRGLVALEVALSLTLLCGAGVLLEGARDLARVDPGFDTLGLFHGRVTLPRDKYKSPADQVAFFDRLHAELVALPGVRAAGIVDVPPGVGGTSARSIAVEGDPAPASNRDLRTADVRIIRSGYLETLGLTPRAGRLFAPADHAAPVAIVNETFARQLLAGRDPVGQRLRVKLRGPGVLDPTPRTVVGVVGDVREHLLYEPAPPTVYLPLGNGDATRMAFVVRTDRPAGELTPLVRGAIMRADPEQAGFGFMNLAELIEGEVSLNRLNLMLLSILAGVALLLAIVGVYGVAAHAARQRTREIAIRLALGLSPAAVRRLLLAEGAQLLIAGLLTGGITAVWGARFLRSLVYGIESTSPATFALATMVLLAAVLAGGYVPARRAGRIEAASVLKSD
jgi:putative ABC transport system permease protein